MSYQVPKAWPGETVVILGGGPSLTQEDADIARMSDCRRIATNNAFMLDPWADVLCWGDIRWFYENRDRIRDGYSGPLKITWHEISNRRGHAIQTLKQDRGGFSMSPDTIGGNSTGCSAVNLAYLFGASRILLLGFDMTAARGNNWHELHTRHASEARFRTLFIPELERAAAILKQRGVEVINCTPNSALTCFPIQSLSEVLRGAACVEV